MRAVSSIYSPSTSSMRLSRPSSSSSTPTSVVDLLRYLHNNPGLHTSPSFFSNLNIQLLQALFVVMLNPPPDLQSELQSTLMSLMSKSVMIVGIAFTDEGFDVGCLFQWVEAGEGGQGVEEILLPFVKKSPKKFLRALELNKPCFRIVLDNIAHKSIFKIIYTSIFCLDKPHIHQLKFLPSLITKLLHSIFLQVRKSQPRKVIPSHQPLFHSTLVKKSTSMNEEAIHPTTTISANNNNATKSTHHRVLSSRGASLKHLNSTSLDHHKVKPLMKSQSHITTTINEIQKEGQPSIEIFPSFLPTNIKQFLADLTINIAAVQLEAVEILVTVMDGKYIRNLISTLQIVTSSRQRQRGTNPNPNTTLPPSQNTQSLDNNIDNNNNTNTKGVQKELRAALQQLDEYELQEYGEGVCEVLLNVLHLYQTIKFMHHQGMSPMGISTLEGIQRTLLGLLQGMTAALPTFLHLLTLLPSSVLESSTGEVLPRVTMTKYHLLRVIEKMLQINEVVDMQIPWQNIDIIRVIQVMLSAYKWNNIIQNVLSNIVRMVMEQDYCHFKKRYLINSICNNSGTRGDTIMTSLIELFRNKKHIHLEMFRMTNNGNRHCIYLIAKCIAGELKKEGDLGHLLGKYPLWQQFIQVDMKQYQQTVGCSRYWSEKIQVKKLCLKGSIRDLEKEKEKERMDRMDTGEYFQTPASSPSSSPSSQISIDTPANIPHRPLQTIGQIIASLQQQKKWNPNVKHSKKTQRGVDQQLIYYEQKQ